MKQHGQQQKTTPERQATIMVDRLVKSYPDQDIGDFKTVSAQLIELIRTYSPEVISRVASPARGLPAKFKFFPRIAEIKTELDAWQSEVDASAARNKRFLQAQLPGPDVEPMPPLAAHATVSALCARFGIKGIPSGWDAIDVTRNAARHGAAFPAYVDDLLAKEGGAAKKKLSPFLEDVRQRMNARIAGEYEAAGVEPQFDSDGNLIASLELKAYAAQYDTREEKPAQSPAPVDAYSELNPPPI